MILRHGFPGISTHFETDTDIFVADFWVMAYFLWVIVGPGANPVEKHCSKKILYFLKLCLRFGNISKTFPRLEETCV